uniref:cellulose 1,4-beta-cellobiosidase (non-reducing end) n=1 Tax=Daphnia galeata TaxID=27404 RepID=A0A8J2WGV9_9CRUS|nr:unnamed protein product [Daphnia galeata]
MIGLIFLTVDGAPESRQASMGIQVCSGPENCQVENTGVVLDFFWYCMFYLLNKELSFEVDVSACGCGMNSAALYFITMETDGGQASSGYTGATYGTARNGILRCPAASARPSCDPYGCGFNTYARGEKIFTAEVQVIRWAAPKSSLSSPDSSPLTEQTTEISRRLSASISRTVALSSSRHSTVACLTNAYCIAFSQSNAQGGVSNGICPNSQGMRKGMVVNMSMWGNPNDGGQMAWLDNEPNGPCPNPIILTLLLATSRLVPLAPLSRSVIRCGNYCRVEKTGVEWYDGDGGKDKWQYVCDFPGNDIGNEKTPGEQCGSLCIDTNCAVTLVTLKESVT